MLIEKFDVLGRILVAPTDLLLAQKLTCLFNRPRPMGRDVYDALFLWGKTEPNSAYWPPGWAYETDGSCGHG